MLRQTLAMLMVACACDGGSARRAAGPGALGATRVAPTEADDPEPKLSAEERALLRELAPSELPPPPHDPTNLLAADEAAARLGQRLFFDPSFSGALLDGDNDGGAGALGKKGEVQKVSCASCHVPRDGFSDTRSLNRQVSLAAGWGVRRTPSLLDVGQSRFLMWDGRRDSLFQQAFAALESEVEMNSSRLFAASQIFARHRGAYEASFGALPPLDDAKRFPRLGAGDTGCAKLGKDNRCAGKLRGTPGDGAEFDGMTAEDRDAVTGVWANAGKALGAYQRRLGCGAGAFDRWVHGDAEALGRAAQRGAALFVGRAGCVRCHSGPYLSDEKFHNVGLRPQLVAVVFIDANDPGASRGLAELASDPLNSRGRFSDGSDEGRVPSGGAELLGAFRTPRLRCVAERPSFMHTAQLRSLAEVVAFFARGGDQFGFPGHNELQPLSLNEREQADLVAFLQSLSGPGPAPELLAPPPRSEQAR